MTGSSYAARILAGNVEFTLAVVLTIGPGIGGTTAVFGVINARLFSGPAPARAHDQDAAGVRARNPRR